MASHSPKQQMIQTDQTTLMMATQTSFVDQQIKSPRINIRMLKMPDSKMQNISCIFLYFKLYRN